MYDSRILYGITRSLQLLDAKGFWDMKSGIWNSPSFVRCGNGQVKNIIETDGCQPCSIWFSDLWFMKCLSKQISPFKMIAETLFAWTHEKCLEPSRFFLLHILSTMDTKHWWFIHDVYDESQSTIKYLPVFQFCCSFSTIEWAFSHHRGCS